MTLDEVVRILEDRVLSRFYGKYEAVVTDDADPLELGRVRARVPAVLGEDIACGWALPCAPSGGGKDRGWLAVPQVGDTVWIEFVAGDPSRPVWSGAFWGSPESTGNADDLGTETGAEVPTHDGDKAGPGRTVLRTAGGHRLVFDDTGDVTILSHGDDQARIVLQADGAVVIVGAKIQLGSDGASEPLVLGNAFMTMFNAHTHPTGVGPSGPPTQPMANSELSANHTTE